MNVNYKKLIMGILLLAQFPAANADGDNILYTSHFVGEYQQCSVKLLDDNSVEVSFNVWLSPTHQIIATTDPSLSHLSHHQDRAQELENQDEALRTLGEELNISSNDTKHIKLNLHRALLSLYFYHADGTRDLTIQLNDIRNISLNGIPPSGSNENTQGIRFDRRSLLPSEYYNVYFKIAANKLNNINIGVTVGGEFSYKGQSYSLLSSDGISFNSDGKECRSFYPEAADIAPPEALKIDPEFRMDSAAWELAPLDLDELLDKTANNRGLPALFNPSQNNRFCLNYRSIATRNNQYMISANNDNKLSPNNQYFQLKEAEGNNFINYKVELRSNENAGADFELPKDKKYIQLTSDDNQARSNMCWEPNITLFSTDTTDKGSYSDTLNFTITPFA
ncbi:TPA: hypothetical protein ACPZRY_002696 [Yersinia enterocolitica]|uniref:hypothetical protein n=1 Tax=Yersinia enterocolitica TaxID=630 RepID=UPI0033050DBB|nr:hypothetical protein [Yersinia enterocolitica]EKN4810481.1 hypothetical protein [Yersinia enterocolitica]HDL7329212.1 hypothetical protein [Yersinia enterocolitica]HDL7354763.1 hypothetical protein [Yersinia enterocolitica]HDL7959378.1 hypothetical protein [Yersinia enterocolitica]